MPQFDECLELVQETNNDNPNRIFYCEAHITDINKATPNHRVQSRMMMQIIEEGGPERESPSFIFDRHQAQQLVEQLVVAFDLFPEVEPVPPAPEPIPL